MTLRHLIKEASEYQVQPFMAPLPTPKTMLFTWQNNLPYWFFAERSFKPGWYWFRPFQDLALWDRKAHPYEYMSYLEALPRFYVIAAAWPKNGKVLVVPLNDQDASQRGWPKLEPRYVHLCREVYIEPWDVLDVRLAGEILLYYAHGQRVAHKPLPETTFFVVESLIEAEERRLALMSKGDRIRAALEFSGAQMLEWNDRGEVIEVRWEYRGETYRQPFNPDLSLRSAGICLAGGDRFQDIVTVVGVMEEARQRDRFDYESRPR